MVRKDLSTNQKAMQITGGVAELPAMDVSSQARAEMPPGVT